MIILGLLVIAWTALALYLTDKFTNAACAELTAHMSVWTFLFGLFSIGAGVYAWITGLPPI